MNRETSEIVSDPQHELTGYCKFCGLVFELHEAACPRCGRCPQCGSKKANGAGRCPVCGHPTDQSKMARLAQRLDVALPTNQRQMRRRDERWKDDEQAKRLNNWRFFAVVVVFFVVVVLPLLVISILIRIPMWIANLAVLVITLEALRRVVRETRRGRFQWLLRKEARITDQQAAS